MSIGGGQWEVAMGSNSCVFDGAIPNIAETLRLAGDEHRRWTMAGAHGISHLTAPLKLLVDLQGRFLLSLSA